MSSIINKSKFIVTVKRRPDLTHAFPHYKGTEAQAYKQKLLSEDKKLVADIARGPLKLFVRIRTRGRPPQYLRVHSYEEAEALDTTTRADELRGVPVNTTKPATVNREMDLLSAVIHKAIDSWQLRRGYPIVPLYESLIAFLLESAPRRSEALALRWCDVDFKDETAKDATSSHRRLNRTEFLFSQCLANRCLA